MPLTFYQLAPSPNNIKVRLALSLKDIPYESVNIELNSDRANVVEATGQPLTPAITHDGISLFGSGAILRYLDANFRQRGPRLFSETQDGMRAIEDWEKWANNEFAQSIGLVIRQLFDSQDRPQDTELAQTLLKKNAPRIESALKDQDYLLGDSPNAADLTLYPWAKYTVIDSSKVPANSPAAFLANRIQLPKEFQRTHAWIARVSRLDLQD